MDSKIIMMCGIPASRKSTHAKYISHHENAIILSSDDIRVELYGDVNHQESNGELFQELYRRAKLNLTAGQNVIIDATNISQKKRINFINDFKQYQREVIYISANFATCVLADTHREKSVGYNVLDRMYRQLQIPVKEEGWDKVSYYFNENNHYGFADLITTIASPSTYEELFEELCKFSLFEDIEGLSHDSSYHSLSVSRHTYYVWNYIMNNYYGEDRLIMLWAALLHDVGKAHCKNFKEGSRYANFVGHENVSAQIAMNFLRELGYGMEFILEVVKVVQNHMRLLDDPNGKAETKIREMYGQDLVDKLLFFREADTSAK